MPQPASATPILFKMLLLLALANSAFGAILESFKRDFARDGLDAISLIAAITWVGSPLLIAPLLMAGLYKMPDDAYFYVSWFGLACLTAGQFAILMAGITRTTLAAATAVGNLSFLPTSLYAILLLGEHPGTSHYASALLAAAGTVLLFDWKRAGKPNNGGLSLLLFSVFLEPLESVLYKFAALHTHSYVEFLTGRLVMDLAYFSLLLVVIRAALRRPILSGVSGLLATGSGGILVGCYVFFHLIDSYLFFKMPVTTLALLGTISIPLAVLLGRVRYGECLRPKQVVATVLIALGAIMFGENPPGV